METKTSLNQDAHLINFNNIVEACSLDYRKTKIICTLGPSCVDVNMLVKMLDAGMNVARISFGVHHEHKVSPEYTFKFNFCRVMLNTLKTCVWR